MTPKEKANQLVNKFSTVGLQQRNEGISCALIAVDEIVEQLKEYGRYKPQMTYWGAVKQEIEKL